MLDGMRSKARSFGIMLIFGIIIVVFVFWGIGNMSGGGSSRTLATVNGERVSVEDFNKVFQPTLDARRKTDPDIMENPEKLKQLKRQVLAEVVKAVLCTQEAERLGIVLTPQELKMALSQFAVFQDASGAFSKDLYLRALAARGMEPGDFEKDYAQELLVNKFIRYVGLSAGVNEAEGKNLFAFTLEKRKAEYVLFEPAAYKAKAVVTDEDTLKEYEADKESFRLPERVSLEFLRLTPAALAQKYKPTVAEAEKYYEENSESFRQPDRFLSRHIFIPFPRPLQNLDEAARNEETAKVRSAMDKVAAELKAGKSFEELARIYSQDQETAPNGGLLGWLNRGDVGSTEFDDAAFALKPGEVSAPVRSDIGFHLIKLEDKKASGIPPFAELQESIINSIAEKKADADFSAVQKAAEDALALNTPFAELGKKFDIKPETTTLLTLPETEKQLSLLADSRKILEEAIAAAAQPAKEDVPAKNATAALHTAIPVPLNIEKGIALVRVREVRPSHIPPFAEVRDVLTDKLKNEKARALAKAAADEALPAFTGKDIPDAYKGKTHMSKEAARAFPLVEPLGSVENLHEGLFSSSGVWLPMVYDTPQGFVIARTASIQPVTDKEWEQWKGVFLPQMQEARKNEAVAAVMRGLDDKADLRLALDVLDKLTFTRAF